MAVQKSEKGGRRMLSFIDELEIANNVYRTQKYIVTQEISVRDNE